MKRLQINAAATVFIKTDQLDPRTRTFQEKEKELRQFAVEFKKFPIPANRIKKALEDLGAAIYQDLERHGLVDHSKG